MRRGLQLLLIVIAATTIVPAASVAQEWTRFRGPNGSGVSPNTTIPASWTADDYAWKIDLPGVGHASPVLWGRKMFLFSADADTATRYLTCVDAETGNTLWEKSFESAKYEIRDLNSLATSTPAVDAERVYVAWSTGAETTLRAFTHDGDPVWEHAVGPYNSRHGFATSPVVIDDVVVLNNQQMAAGGREAKFEGGASFLLALDGQTGDVRWQTPRNSTIAAHSVPCVYQPPGGPTQVIFTSTAHGIIGVDLLTGEELWSLPAVFEQRCVGSPIVADGLVLAANGNGAGANSLLVVKPDAKPTIAYDVRRQVPYVPTPVVKGDLAFLWSDRGIVTCIDLAGGDVHWQKRVGGNYFSSPVIAGKHLYGTDVNGVVTVLAADRTYKLLGKNPLDDQCHATPAIANGRLYVRTFRHLVAIGGK